MPVFLHGGPASGGVDDNRIDLGGLERSNHLLREGDGLVFQSGVNHERSATTLSARDEHLASFRRKHTRCGRVDVRKEDLLHASAQKAYPLALYAFRPYDGWQFVAV